MKAKVEATFKRVLTNIIILSMIICPMHVAVASAIEDPHDVFAGERIVGGGIDNISNEENNFEDDGLCDECGDPIAECECEFEFESNNSPEEEADSVLSPLEAGPYTVEFFLGDGTPHGASQVVNEGEQAVEPAAPSKLNLIFAGWYIDGSAEPFNFETPIEEDLQLYAGFTATVTFYTDDLVYGVAQKVFEGEKATKPADPEKDGYTFVEWRSYQYGVFNFDTAITGHLNLTARFTKNDDGGGDRYADYWAAGPGGSIRNFTCPDCGYTTGNNTYNGPYVLYFYPLGSVPPGGRQLALIVVTCTNCGTISELYNTSNGGASLAGPGQTPSAVNNMGVGDARLIAIFVSVTFQPGSDGQLSDNGPGVIEKVEDEDIVWDTDWEPKVYPNAGFSHIGWRDQDGNIYSVKGSFPAIVDKSYVFTAVYSNKPVITIIADSAEKIYDGTELTAEGWTAYGPDGSKLDAFTATGLIIAGSQTNVGSSPNEVIIDEDTRFFSEGGDITEGFVFQTINGNLVVTPRPVRIVADNKEKVYGSADPAFTVTVIDLVNDETLSGDTLNYTLARDPGENVGTYDIIVTLGENPNYSVEKEDGVFTITPKSVGVKVTADNKTKVYGDADPTLTATVDGTVGNDTLNYTLARDPGENVGAYEIIVTLGENPNYIVTKEDGTFTITPKSIGVKVTAENKSKVYGSADPVLTAIVTGVVGNDTLNYTLSRTPGENVGSYDIIVTLGENPNYIVEKQDGVLVIIPDDAVLVVAENKTKVYGDADPVLTATVTGLVGNDTINYTLTRTPGEDVGTYNIIVTLGSNPNYNVIKQDGILTITPKSAGVKVTADDKEKVYGSSDPTLTATVTGTVGNDTLNYTLTRTPGENVGTYDIVVTLGNNPNYIVAKQDGLFTITPKSLDVKVTAENKTKVYGYADPTLTAIVTGLVGNDALNFTLAREPGENVGTYRIIVTLGNNPNYTVAKEDGVFTITPKSVGVSVRAENKTKVYGATDPALTAIVTGLVGSDALNYTLARAPGENAGTYDIVVTLGSNPNYIVAKEDGVFTISRRAATITVNDAWKYFAANDPVFTGSVAGLINVGDLETISYVRTNDAEVVGNYPSVLNANFTANANYTVTVVRGDFEIREADAINELTVQMDSLTVVYDGEEHALAAAVPSETGASLSYTYNGETTAEMPVFVNAGTYEITVNASLEGYENATATATLTITRKAATVTVNNSAKVFGSADPVFTATMAGFVQGEAPTPAQYVITRTGVGTTAGEAVGYYSGVLVIANNGFNGSNYTISWNAGNFTITTAAVVTPGPGGPGTSVTSSPTPTIRPTATPTPTPRPTATPTPTPTVIVDDTPPLGAVELPDSDVPMYLETDDHRIFLYGYPDYTVKPEQGITRAEAASIFYRLLQVEYMENNAVSAFNDVNDEDWFAQAINTLAELNIILGYEDGTFRPNDPITRAEFATIATRFDELSPADGIAFSDVSEDHWAVDFISSAYAVGWVGGYEDGTFRPEQNISRAEVVKIVNTMLNRLPEHLPEELENPYTDIEVSHWAYIHIIEASIEHKYDRDGNGIERWLSYIPGGYLARRDDDNGAGGAGDGDDVDDDGEAGE